MLGPRVHPRYRSPMVDEVSPPTASLDGPISGALPRIDIVVVGAQKALSTSFAAMLGQHPEVFMASGEFHGFLDNEHAAGGSARVFELVSGAKEPIKGFKCASYLGEPDVPRRLNEELDTPHIVAGLRHPVERAVSAWYWWIRTGVLPPIAAEQGLADALDGKGSRHAQQVLEWGLYASHLDRYREVFPAGRLHVFADVEMKADPEGAIRRLYAAVGVDPTFLPNGLRMRYNEGIYSLARLRWLRLRQRYVWQEDADGVWRHARPIGLYAKVANAAVVGIDRIVLRRLIANQPPTLSPVLRRRMLEYYATDTARLEEDLGIDLRAWMV